MAVLEFDDIHKAFGRKTALDGVSMRVADDTLTVVCGPPLAGKSVLLRMLVGLETPDSGTLRLDGEDLTRVRPGDRHIGYVPQSFALYPHMSVYRNIAYPLHLRRASATRVRERVDHVAELLDIRPLLDKTPDQLSGGEKQRTAVARGLVDEASIFVLDDPLVGLDFKLRERLMEDLRDMRRQLGITFLYATSDPLEALTMADEVVVLDEGRVVEHNEVGALYQEPSWLRSAELIGFPRCNVIRGRWEGGRLRTDGFDCGVAAQTAPDEGSELAAVVRPEDVLLEGYAGDGEVNGGISGRARVRLVEDLGGESVVHLGEGETDSLVTVLPLSDQGPPAEEIDIGYRIDPGRVIVFDAGSGERIGRGEGERHA